MQNKWMIPLLVIASMAIAACGKKSESHRVIQEVTQAGPIYKVGNMNAEDFYRQFLFRLIDSCGKRTVNYRFPESEIVKVAVNKFGQDVLAELSVLMYADHSFKALYREVDVTGYTATGFFWKNSREKTVRGKWQVVENRLALSGLGVAVGIQGENYPAMLLTMNTDLIMSGLTNRVLMVRNVVADYVPVPGADPCR